jgi:hypothetical protein
MHGERHQEHHRGRDRGAYRKCADVPHAPDDVRHAEAAEHEADRAPVGAAEEVVFAAGMGVRRRPLGAEAVTRRQGVRWIVGATAPDESSPSRQANQQKQHALHEGARYRKERPLARPPTALVGPCDFLRRLNSSSGWPPL